MTKRRTNRLKDSRTSTFSYDVGLRTTPLAGLLLGVRRDQQFDTDDRQAGPSVLLCILFGNGLSKYRRPSLDFHDLAIGVGHLVFVHQRVLRGEMIVNHNQSEIVAAPLKPVQDYFWGSACFVFPSLTGTVVAANTQITQDTNIF